MLGCYLALSFFFFNKFPTFLLSEGEKICVCLEFYYLWLRSVDCDYYRRASSTTNLIFVFTFFYFSLSNGEGDEKSFDFSEKLNIEFSLIFESLPHSIKNTSALLSFSPRRSKLNFNLDPPNPT